MHSNEVASTGWDRVGVAVAGLGSMGLGMAASLLRAGADVTGYDPDPNKREDFAALGGKVAVSSVEASRGATLVVSVVVDAGQTEALLFGDEGIATVMAEDGVFISCATMAPDRARRMAARLEATGRHYLDAPVSGGARRAADGSLTILASGTEQAFARAAPALDAMSATLHRLGEAPGEAAAFKMVNQLLAGVHIAAASEAIAFAAREGLDLHRVYEVITASAGNSWMFENRVPHILDGDYRPLSAVDIFVKDLGIVLDMGRASSFPAPLASAALQLFIMTSAAGMGRDDDSSVARLYARIAGLDLSL
ncbi:3-hydroxyisobutyrate dehydrogenase [Luteibacter jiangsuensis]|uniref:L-threonate dehydrogenase n=1 Tax=Luteibacter jiangsuensis TaxID=637577 RepID=A0ABT9SW15_9GAMM|nr:L-threonate dehydrogenase [Luteibacter jiangsuensis]MDQ0009191.1 3-hydroxyisobutyrate dehydrogenase [Luteibacter jiangsuensis]